MADPEVQNVLVFPSVRLGVGESAVARKVAHRALRLEHLSVALRRSRLSALLKADELRDIEVASVKIGGEEQLAEPLPGALFLPGAATLRLPFSKAMVLPGDAITVVVRDVGARTVRRTIRRLMLHRQAVVVLIEGVPLRHPEGRVVGTTATPVRADGEPILRLAGSRRTPDQN